VRLASRLSRAKKRREFLTLKEANEKLRDEGERLKIKINQLKCQVENKLSSSELEMIAENAALKIQLQNHKAFFKEFMRLTTGTPSTRTAQHDLCRQGSVSAQDYLKGLIAQSQLYWDQLKPPQSKSLAASLSMLNIHYQLLDNGLFQADKNSKGLKRFNLRIDLSFPNLSAKKVADWYWNTFVNSAQDQCRLLGVEKFEFKSIDSPDPNTQLVYNHKEWENKKDQGTVFICNRKEETLLRSTLAPPLDEAAEDEGKASEVFGKVKAHVVAMTATHSTLETMRSYGPELRSDIPEDVNHITSVVIQGSVSYEEDGVCHFINVLSFPENYRIIDLAHSECIREDGTMTEEFGQILEKMTKEMAKDLMLPQAS